MARRKPRRPREVTPEQQAAGEAAFRDLAERAGFGVTPKGDGVFQLRDTKPAAPTVFAETMLTDRELDGLRVLLAEEPPLLEQQRLRVVSAAMLMPHGLVLSVPAPGRHHNIIHALHALGVKPTGGEQGFLLSDGQFVRRKPAVRIAEEARQLLERAPTAGSWAHGLFSEDVW